MGYRDIYKESNEQAEERFSLVMERIAEIAEEMNLSVKSINRYKQKTMELLRNELKDYMPLLLLLLPYQ